MEAEMRCSMHEADQSCGDWAAAEMLEFGCTFECGNSAQNDRGWWSTLAKLCKGRFGGLVKVQLGLPIVDGGGEGGGAGPMGFLTPVVS